jgi:hypothetical protein
MVSIRTFLLSWNHQLSMANQFGHGFITNIMLIAKHFGLPPEQAWFGAGDHVEGLVPPDKFRVT